MTEPGRATAGHSGLLCWQQDHCNHDMAAAVFKTDHNHASGAPLYVAPPSPSMSPSPPWKVGPVTALSSVEILH